MNVGLALGGGGARGFAHIGVFRALSEAGHVPTAVAGCSMGGIVGAFIAAGYDVAKIEQTFRSTNPIKLLDRSRGGALMGSRGIAQELSRHLPETFESLELPFSVTAVDVNLGRLVVLRSGPLIPALRATSALPGILSPVHLGGRTLIDGGLLNNLPVDLARAATLDPIVAVDVSTPPNRDLQVHPDDNAWKKLVEPIAHGRRPFIVELFVKAYDIPQALITEMRLAVNPPDLLIRPPLDPSFKLEDYHKFDQALDVGFRAAEKQLRDFPAPRAPGPS